MTVDKKTKKRLEILHQKKEKCQKQLAGAKSQTDELEEIEKLQLELQQINREIELLKNR